jgi:hypothetical protein
MQITVAGGGGPGPKSTPMKRLLWLTVLVFGCQKEAGAPAADAPPPTPAPKATGPDWAAAFKHTISADPAQNQVVVKVEIQPGFHAYTVGETVGKPLALEVSEESAYALDGEVQYPAGVTKDLPIGKSVIVEGQAEVRAKVKAKTDGKGMAKGTFRYQVCTDEACDRPRNVPFEVAVSPQ